MTMRYADTSTAASRPERLTVDAEPDLQRPAQPTGLLTQGRDQAELVECGRRIPSTI
jgi:hypothetical protein